MDLYNHKDIRIIYNEDTSHIKSHFHDEYEFYYLISGKVLFFIKDRVYPMVSGCLAFIDGEEMHRVSSKSNNNYKRFVICIKRPYLIKNFPELSHSLERGNCIALSTQQQVQTEDIIARIVQECGNSALMQHELIEALAKQFLICMYRIVSLPLQKINYSGGDILKILQYIDEHYTEKITLNDICEYLDISVSHLTRLFKTSTGYTLVEYINNLRIREAGKLLVSTKEAISQIALDTGFESFSYFGKLFSKYYNLSPMKYRRKHRKNSNY